MDVNKLCIACMNEGITDGLSGYFAGGSIPLGREPIMVGRNYKLCQLVFPEDIAGVSGIHCSICYDEVSKTFYIGEDNGFEVKV